MFFDYHLKASEIISTAREHEEESYVPLPFDLIKPESKVPFDIFLMVRGKDSSESQFTQCLAQGQVFPKKWYIQLKKGGTPNIYFQPTAVEGVIQYLEQQLASEPEIAKRRTLELDIILYDIVKIWTRNFLTSERAPISTQLWLSLRFIDELFTVLRQESLFIGYVLDIRRHDAERYIHSWNVCLMALAFAAHLGWTTERAKNFSLGALLHDIGMTEVPPSILQKQGPLTGEERQQIERHPGTGFRMLRLIGSNRPDSLFMVQQHHENVDGSGYPDGLKIGGIHPLARILRIIDSFEAMTAPRPWRPAWSAEEVMWFISNDWQLSQKYDPWYLTKFLKFLSGG